MSNLRATRLARSLTPGWGGVVMGTGIVSVALSMDGRATLARALLALAAVVWLALCLALMLRVRVDLPGLRRDARTASAPTGAAATAVLGSGALALGWRGVAVALLLTALLAWLAVLAPVLLHWRTPTNGASLLLPVATEAIAASAAELGRVYRAAWLIDASLVWWALGIGLYLFVMRRFDLSQLRLGRGEHWVAGGALAVSTLALAQVVDSAASVHVLTSAAPALKVALWVLWICALIWLPVLIGAEVLVPRVRYDLRRWSTVFPVGMYAACSFAAGAALREGAVTRFAEVWVWVGLAVWALVLAAGVRHSRAPSWRSVR